MRDRWLRDAFAVGLPSPTGDSEHLNENDDRKMSTLNSMDEEEAIRLLIDYGIAEDKAKVRLQVKIRHFFVVALFHKYVKTKFKSSLRKYK
jgi:hypothetical protein